MDLIIKPTELCNFKCTFCSSTHITEDKATILDLQYIYDFLNTYPNTNTIIVNGGDPLMIDPQYYWDIIKYLDKHDLPATLSLTSNLWPFYKKPEKWVELFNHERVGIATSFQYGSGRLKGDYTVFTEEDFWNVSDTMLELVGYRPTFISVISEENEHTVIDTVKLAKEMGVVCKINHAMASGIQYKPYRLSKIYEMYIKIHEAGLTDWEYNTQQMIKVLRDEAVTCPLSRNCDKGIRAYNPSGDLYTCGAFADDLEYEITLGQKEVFNTQLELQSLKQSCYTCPMFKICNGCRKTISDLKKHNMVEDHCYHMKQLAEKIITYNNVNLQVTPYVDESPDIIAKS